MFETLTKGFRAARQSLQGLQELTEENIAAALRDVRVSLLEADVEFGVTKAFLERVRSSVLGEVVKTKVDHKGRKQKVTAEEHFIKACHDELTALMGPVDTSLRFSSYGITKIMMVGLQGSGKTTSAAKLALYLQKQYQKKPMLVAADVYRPAAIQQLKVLGQQLDIPVYAEEGGSSPPDICERSLAFARANKRDLVIFDTAGRLAIDETLMGELESIKRKTVPDDIYLVVDAMIGQDAVNTAREFNDRIDLHGIVLTKMDGDARGGAALSIKQITGKPIKFVGMGEGLGQLEEFRPEGLASRILGFGDIVGLMKDFEGIVDEEKAEEEARKLLEGRFTFIDFLEQIRSIKKMGSLRDLLDKMPFFPDGLPEGVTVDDRELVKVEAIIQSMTPLERTRPSVFNTPTRIRRVARGSGRSEREVQELLSKFRTMQRMMEQIGGSPGFWGNLPGVKQLRQMQSLQGVDMDALFGGAGGALPAPDGGLPRGHRPLRLTAASSKDREKDKNKKKAQRRARKGKRR